LSSSQKKKRFPSKSLQQCFDTAAIEGYTEEEEALSAAATAGLGLRDQPSLLHPQLHRRTTSAEKTSRCSKRNARST